MKKSSILKAIGFGTGIIILILLGIVIGKLVKDCSSLSTEKAALEVSINKLEKRNKSLKEELEQLEDISKEYNLLKDQVQNYEEQLAKEEEVKAEQESLKEENEAEEQAYKEKGAISLVRAYLEGGGYVPKYIEIDHMEGSIYVVHAYDVVEYPGEVGHTATIGWYDVDVETMEVTSMF